MPDLHTLFSAALLPPPPDSSEADYVREIRSLRTTLKQTPTDKLAGESPGQVNSTLDALDPSQQSLIYIFVLLAHYHVCQTTSKQDFPDTLQPGGYIWSRSLTFLKEFDPVQIRYAGHEWVRLVELVGKAAESASRPLLAVQPIKHALLRLDPSCSTFTSTHTLLVRLCLRAKTYVAALPILERDISHVPPRSEEYHLKMPQMSWCRPQLPGVAYITTSSGLSGKLSHRHYLEYFLYGSMVYIGLKKWDAALRFLQVVIAAPTNNSVSMIMVQAYKKWVIVCLLAKGTLLPMPKTTNTHAVKLCKSLARAYDALADVFRGGSFPRLKAEVDAGESIWHADNNTGLVFQVMEAYHKFSILALERTFAALSVKDIPSVVLTQPTDSLALERFAARLIGRGNLDARLAQPSDNFAPTILRFATCPNNRDLSSEIEAWTRSTAQKNRIRPLTENMYEADTKLELGPDYVESMRRARRLKDNENREGGTSTRNGRDELDFEEDIMAGTH